MPKEKLTAFLRDQNFLSTAVREQITAQFKSKQLLKDQLQLTEGKICDEYLFLESGYLRAFAYNINGKEVTTGFYSPGQMVFEVSSFFNRTRSKENIQALTDCAGWYISYRQLNELFHTLPEFREFGRSVLVKGIAGLKNRMLTVITETAEERYEQLLKSDPDIFRVAHLKHIASYLGITDTSLSRIRKDLTKK